MNHIQPYWKLDRRNVDKNNLHMWLRRSRAYEFLGVEKSKRFDLAKKIYSSINDWQLFIEYEKQGSIWLYDTKEKMPRYYPILFSKVCKEGRVLKIGINTTRIEGAGHMHTAAVFPVISLERADPEVSITIKPKVVLCQNNDRVLHLHEDVDAFEGGGNFKKKH